MAVVMELRYGDAKIFVCDDMYKNISTQEMEDRKKAVRMAMGRVAAADGAAERFKAYKEKQALEKTNPLDQITVVSRVVKS